MVAILLPVAIFVVIYFLLGKWPNYLFNDVDTEGVYMLEKELFGIVVADGAVLTPSEYFALHHAGWMDVMSAVFYLCWVPLPAIYALVLYWQKRQGLALRLTWAFLITNLVGFAGYYIHPAAPPWYVMKYGFEVIEGTMGSEAGFANADAITGIPFFHWFYCHNANVFAAIPSLHSAYNPIAFYYALCVSRNRVWQTVIAIVMAGIWFSAVYSGHHYVIDVILGTLCSVVGVTIMELSVRYIKPVRDIYEKIIKEIK